MASAGPAADLLLAPVPGRACGWSVYPGPVGGEVRLDPGEEGVLATQKGAPAPWGLGPLLGSPWQAVGVSERM